MTTKTRKAVKAYERDIIAEIRVDAANSRAGLFINDTEVFRFSTSAASLLLPTTFAGVNQGVVKVTDAASYDVLAANSGKVHILPNLTASCTLSLPTPADGLNYKFVYGGVASDAQNAIFDTGSDTNFFLGGVMFADHDSADAEIAPVFPDGNSNSVLTVVTPSAGTEINLWCDGTNWYLSGVVDSASAPTFGDQS